MNEDEITPVIKAIKGRKYEKGDPTNLPKYELISEIWALLDNAKYEDLQRLKTLLERKD